MGAADKLLNVRGFMAMLEAGYGAGGALLPATHGILPMSDPSVSYSYLHDGSRAGDFSGTMKRAPKSGRAGSFTLEIEPTLPAAAYGAAVTSNFHLLLRASGHAATLTATAGSEKYVYAPSLLQTDLGSLATECHYGGQKYPLVGVMGNFKFAWDGPAIPLMTFEGQGIASATPSDVSEATTVGISYMNTMPPKAESVTCTIGSFTGVVLKAASFDAGRELSPRTNDNATGHNGFAMGRPKPTLELLIERTLLATTPFHQAARLDPYQLDQLGSAVGVSFTIGSVKYNKWGFAALNAQLSDVAEEADGPVAMWRLKFDLKASTPFGVDCYTLTTD